MHKKRFLFVGVRTDILHYMLEKNMNVVALLPENNAYHHKKLEKISFKTKEHIIENITKIDFDIFVSNGCPYILPVSKIQKSHQIFINIHPSLLPKFKGLHPINGAIFLSKETGATCHIMDDSIDGGKIISQVELHNDMNIQLPLLYQMCFLAELEAFKIALQNKFMPLSIQPKERETYFKRSDINSTIILEQETSEDIINKTKALSIKGQFIKIFLQEKEMPIKSASIIHNDFLSKIFTKHHINTIVLKYENFVLIKKDKHFLELELIEHTNTNLFNKLES